MVWVKKYINNIKLKKMDCTQYLEFILKDHFNIEYNFPQREGSLFSRSYLIKKHLPTFCVPTDTPKTGDVVLMSGNRRLCHVGMYIKDGISERVLHKDESMESGAYHRIQDLFNYGYTVGGYYTWVK